MLAIHLATLTTLAIHLTTLAIHLAALTFNLTALTFSLAALAILTVLAGHVLTGFTICHFNQLIPYNEIFSALHPLFHQSLQKRRIHPIL